MTRKHLVTALQCLLAIGLLYFVLNGVAIRDVARSKKPPSGAEETLKGTIEGPAGVARPWEAPVVEFAVLEGATRSLDAKEWEVTPGLKTLYLHLALGPYLLAAALFLVGVVCAIVRWWSLVHVLRIPFTMRAATRWTFVGFFFNNVVPGLVGGDLPKMYFVARDAPRKTHAVLTVMVDRILGLLALAVVAAVAYAVDFRRYQTPELQWIGWLILGVLAALVGGCVLASWRGLRRFLVSDEKLLRLPGGKILHHVEDAIALYRGRPWVLVGAIGLSCCNHVLSMIAWWLIGSALGGTLSMGPYFVIVPIIQMAKSVPLTPAGWGVGEALFAKLLPLYGETPTLGVALSITYQLTYLAFSLVGGVLLATSSERASAAEMERGVAQLEEPAP